MKLDTSRNYHVDNMYAARLTQLEDGTYEITYLGLTLRIQIVNEMLCGSKAVLCVGEKKTKKKLVVTPSPLMKEVSV